MKRLLEWLDSGPEGELTYTTAIIWLLVLVVGCILAGLNL